MVTEQLKMKIQHALMFFSVLILLGSVLLSPISRALGAVEGKYFPVLDPLLTIAEIERSAPYESVINGSAVKIRDCTYISESLQWYLGDPSRSVEVAAQFTDPPSLRDSGHLTWSGVIVGLSENQVRKNSYATILHDCGWPWMTKSIFYQSNQDDEAAS